MFNRTRASLKSRLLLANTLGIAETTVAIKPFTSTSQFAVEGLWSFPVRLTLINAQVSVDDQYSSSESGDNCRKV